MNSTPAAITAATAAVFVGGRQAGTAVLVDRGRLLTAGHVLHEGVVGRPVDVVEVVFPLAAPGGSGGGEWTVSARPVPVDGAPAALDVCVLDVDLDPGGEPPSWLAPPVPVRPGRGLPARVRVFGYPRQERQLRGVWRDFTVSGPAADGLVQLDWPGDVGTLPGHSGGPVVDADSGHLVGILVEGSAAGQFDRFLTINAIRAACPGLPTPWLFAGSPDARVHVEHRARGYRSHADRGDLFTGRERAVRAVRDWLTAPQPPGRVLVVTGQPGAGKSAVLARAVLELEAGRTGTGVAFHARGATNGELLAALADLAGVGRVNHHAVLADRLAADPPDAALVVVVDALDEAYGAQGPREMARTLVELAAQPWVRVAVATRALAAGDRHGPGSLLRTVAAAAPDAGNLVDLDTDRYFDPDGLRRYAAALLARDGREPAGSPELAWAAYRQDRALRTRLAAVVADRAGRNYLVAAISALALAGAAAVVDPDSAGFQLAGIPSGMGEALGKYIDTLSDRQAGRARVLLTALAYARGQGLPDRTWLAFAAALGSAATPADLERLCTRGAADLLVRSDTGPTDGTVTRLFHQALVDELRDLRDQAADEGALLAELLAAHAVTGDRDSYASTYAADHAAAAGLLPRALGDPVLLGYADLHRVLAVAQQHEQPATAPTIAVLRHVAARANPLPAHRRLRLMALTAAHLGLHGLHRQLAALGTGAVTPVWAHALGSRYLELRGHTGRVLTVAIGEAAGRAIVVSADADGTVRGWDAVGGQPLWPPITGHTAVPDRVLPVAIPGVPMFVHESRAVDALAIGRVAGRDVIVSGGDDGTVRIWDARTGRPTGEPITSHTPDGRSDGVAAVALGELDGRDVIVAGGGGDHAVRIWDAATGQQIGQPLAGHTGTVLAVALGRVAGRDIVVSGGLDGTVRIWDAGTGRQVGDPLTGHPEWVQGLALGRIGDRDVIASCGWHDLTIRMWDAVTGAPFGQVATNHETHVERVVLGRLGGRAAVISQGLGDIQFRDPGTGTPIGPPVTHTQGLHSLALGRAGERDIIATGRADDVLVFDTVTPDPTARPIAGSGSYVTAVVFGRAGGRDAVISGSFDQPVVWVWDAVTGGPIWRLDGHTAHVTSLAVGNLAGRDVLVSGSFDRTVRVWDAATGRAVGPPLAGHASLVKGVAVGYAAGRPIIVSCDMGAAAGQPSNIFVWDAATARPIGRLIGHELLVTAVAAGRIGQLDAVLTSSNDGMVLIWDLATGRPAGRLDHGEPVTAMAFGRVAGQDIVVAASMDPGYTGDRYRLSIWHAATGRLLGECVPDGEVRAVAVGQLGGHGVVVSGGASQILQVWDTGGRLLDVIDLLAEVRAVAVSPDGRLCATAANALCLFRPTGTFPAP